MKTFRLFLAIVVALSAASAFARVWTDKFGKTTQGKFVRYFDGDVVLLRGTRAVTIPYADLSDDDREFVRLELEKKGEAGLLPPDPADEEFKLPEPSEERTWTSNDGKKIKAKLVAVSGKKVTLLVKEKEFTVPMKRLSRPDQQYAKSQQRKPQDAAQPPPNQFAGAPNHPSMRPAMPTMPSNPPPGFHGPSFPTPAFPGPSSPPSIPAPQIPSTPAPSFPQPTPTPMPHAEPPTFPADTASQTPQPSQQLVEYKYCSQCQKTIPSNLGAGDKCPHCGVFFSSEEDASGRTIKRAPIGKYFAFGGGIPGLAILIGLLIRWLKQD
jgi:hypothetical protein